MKQAISAVLQRYGNAVSIEKTVGDPVTVRALLQPVNTKSMQSMQEGIVPGGTIPMGQYIYVGPPSETLADAEYLTMDGVDYIVRRREIIRVRDENLFVWALCSKSGREDPWTS